mmetsp:Transcript_4442/g.14480  ORF Transcript_4442/g.14480 Transcript_4442/m.14480 type:complete len:248 (-) Transcript_4442:30-773(-)
MISRVRPFSLRHLLPLKRLFQNILHVRRICHGKLRVFNTCIGRRRLRRRPPPRRRRRHPPTSQSPPLPSIVQLSRYVLFRRLFFFLPHFIHLQWIFPVLFVHFGVGQSLRQVDFLPRRLWHSQLFQTFFQFRRFHRGGNGEELLERLLFFLCLLFFFFFLLVVRFFCRRLKNKRRRESLFVVVVDGAAPSPNHQSARSSSFTEGTQTASCAENPRLNPRRRRHSLFNTNLPRKVCCVVAFQSSATIM